MLSKDQVERHSSSSRAIQKHEKLWRPFEAFWSESERALRGTRGAYGLNVLRHLQGQNGSKMQEIRKAAAAGSLQLEILDDTSNNGHVLFVASCGEAAQERALLSAALACVHETHAAEVRGSLVLRGFPASWSEKGLKFVFAPFGGLTSVTIEEEEENAQPICVSGEVAPSGRLAYVKLRNSQAMDKAVANLHQTKVGDGDLVEDVGNACSPWTPGLACSLGMHCGLSPMAQQVLDRWKLPSEHFH
eukprot:g31625.t1